MSPLSTPLWRNPDFMRLWTAQTVSAFGARITREGLPLAALLTIDASPGQLGVLAALSTGPMMIVGLFGGGLVDRSKRRGLMIGADIARAVLLFTIPLAAWAGALHIFQLYLIAALVGGVSVLFDLADHAFLPTLIARDDLTEGNSKLEVTDSLAEVGGPAVAGLLVQALTAPIAIAVNAATYLFSALALMRIEKTETPPKQGPPPAHWLSDAAAGLHAVMDNRLVRPLFMMSMTSALFGSIFAALYLFYAIKTLSLSPFMLGLTIAAGGLGALVGALTSPALTRALGVGPAILTAWTLMGTLTLLIPLAQGTPVMAMAILIIAQFGGDGFAVAANIGAATLRQSVLPNAIMGRAGGVFQMGGGAASIIGALGGGLLGETIGPRLALLIATLGLLAATGWGLASPLRALRDLPQPEESSAD